MISHIDITSIHYEASEELKKYINKKLSRLDRFAPRHARKTISVEVILEERKTKTDRNQCEIIINLPERQLTAKEATVNMFAAVDIVEAKIKTQLKKYKETHGGDKSDRRGMLRKLFRNQRNS
jgi:putative sigma-54 modulation protein